MWFIRDQPLMRALILARGSPRKMPSVELSWLTLQMSREEISVAEAWRDLLMEIGYRPL